MVIGYTTGVYDMFHIGHLNILRRAKAQCDYLIVGVSTDALVEHEKNKKPIIPFADRCRIVEAIRYVDQVVPQEDKNKYGAWEKYHFDKMFVGSDWKGTPQWEKYEAQLSPHGVQIVYLDHTDGISSTILREKLKTGGIKMYQPKVTIIIPVYNGSNFLAEAIDAALAQTYPNIEILVVNDGSKDDGASERIALSYGDRIRYYRKENGGVSSALNFAFEKMTGRWFSWLSHDDLYLPEKVEKQIAFLNTLLESDPNVDLEKLTVRTATVSIDKDGRVIKIPSYKNVPKQEKPIDTILNNISNYRLSGCSFLLPTACIADIGGFNESIRTVSDVEYWYRLLFAGYQFYCLSDERLVKNRSHGRQVGKTKVTLFDREMNELFVWIADTMNQNPAYSTLKNNEKMYYGLIKRRCSPAAKHVRETYLKPLASKADYRLKYSLISSGYVISGTARNILRSIYRRVFVK